MRYRAGGRQRQGQAEAESRQATESKKRESSKQFEALFGQREDSEGIRRQLAGVSGMEQGQCSARDGLQKVGRDPDCIPGISARKGRGPQQSQLCDSRGGFLQSWHKGPFLSANGPAVNERMEASVSTPGQDAASIQTYVSASKASGGFGKARNWVGHTAELFAVPQTFRAFQIAGSRHSEAHQGQRRGFQELCHTVTPDGTGSALKNQAMGRDVESGLAPFAISGASAGKGVASSRAGQAGAGISCQHGGGGQFHGEAVAFVEAFPFRNSTHVQIAPRGGLVRKCKQAPGTHGHPGPRLVAKSEVSEELRERGSASATVRQPRRRRSASKRQSKIQNRQTLPVPALGATATLKFAVFLEIFCGCARLGRKIHLECGWPVLLWDVSFGDQYDLTVRSNQQRIIHWLQHGHVRAGHLGTPCRSFGRARDRAGGPPQLRTDDQPMGKPNLRLEDAGEVRVGNVLLHFTCRVLLLAVQYQLPFTLENPKRSRLWITPPVSRLLRKQCVETCNVDFCMFGTAWRKPTKILSVHLALGMLHQYQCYSSKRGVCCKSGKTHIPLAGQTPQGQWLTKLAEPYPWQFAKVLAKTFYNTELAMIAAEFGRHLNL